MGDFLRATLNRDNIDSNMLMAVPTPLYYIGLSSGQCYLRSMRLMTGIGQMKGLRGIIAQRDIILQGSVISQNLHFSHTVVPVWNDILPLHLVNSTTTKRLSTFAELFSLGRWATPYGIDPRNSPIEWTDPSLGFQHMARNDQSDGSVVTRDGLLTWWIGIHSFSLSLSLCMSVCLSVSLSRLLTCIVY